MKIPREILFQRHEAAGPMLDAIRREVIAGQCQPVRSVRDRVGIAVRLWRELFLPCRRVWLGLAAVWLLLLVINVSQRDNSPRQLAQSSTGTGPVMTLYNQEKILNELLADRTQPVEATRPPKFEPKPRSEAAAITTI